MRREGREVAVYGEGRAALPRSNRRRAGWWPVEEVGRPSLCAAAFRLRASMRDRLLGALFSLAVAGCGGPSAMLDQADTMAGDANTAAKRGDFVAALDLQERAVALVDRLVQEHPDSEATARIGAGHVDFGGVPLAELQGRVMEDSRLRVRALSSPAACAVFLADRTLDPKKRRHGLARVATILASSHPDEARWAARQIEEGEDDKVTALLAVGALADALKAARAVSAIRQRWPQIVRVTRALIAAGQLKEAVDAARPIPESAPRAEALAAIGHALAANDRGDEASIILKEALEAAKLIVDDGERARVFIALAATFAQGGAIDGARSLLERAQKFAMQVPFNQQQPLLVRVAQAYGAAGDLAGALTAIGALTGDARKTSALLDFARSASGSEGATEAVLVAAFELSKTLAESRDRAEARAELAFALAARKHLASAQRVAVNIRAAGRRAHVIVTIASDVALPEWFNLAIEAADKVFDPAEQAGALMAVAAVLGRVGDLTRGNEVLARAWKVVADADNPMARTARLMALVEAALREGQTSVAAEGLAKLEASAPNIKEPLTRASELAHLAAIYTAAKQPARAAEALRVAIEAAQKLEFEGSQVRILLGLMRLLEPLGAHGDDGLKPIYDTALTVRDADRRAGLMVVLARAFAARKRWDEALAATDKVSDAVTHDEALVAMVTGAAKGSGADKALELAVAVKSRDRQAVACAMVAAQKKAPGVSGKALLARLAREAAP